MDDPSDPLSVKSSERGSRYVCWFTVNWNSRRSWLAIHGVHPAQQFPAEGLNVLIFLLEHRRTDDQRGTPWKPRETG